MEEREKEINLKDLCIKLLSKWTWMIIVGLIMAMLLVGYKYVKDERNKTGADENVIKLEEMYDDLTFDEKGNVDTYFSTYDRLISLREDMNTRVIYQIDPYHEKVLRLVYDISLPDIAMTDETVEYLIADHLNDDTKLNHICALYTNKVQSEEFIESILGYAGGISEEDMRTLISSNNSNGLLYINVICTDNMDIDGMSDAIKNCIDEYATNLYKTEQHNCIFVEESFKEIIDDGLINTWNNLLSSEYNLYTQASNYKKNFGENEKKYIDYYFTEKDAGDLDDTDAVKKDEVGSKDFNLSKLSKKWIILGFLVGVFLVCIWEVFIYVISGKLHTEDDLTLYHGLQLFGTQYAEGRKASKKNGWAYKLFNRGKKVLSPEEQKEIIISGIEIYCKQNDIKDIVITGTDMQEEDETYITELMDELKKNGISYKLEKNIYYYPKALQSAVDSEGIILVEKLENSYDNEIDNVLQKAGEYNIKVLGTIALI